MKRKKHRTRENDSEIERDVRERCRGSEGL